MSHPYVDSFLMYRNYRLQASANRAQRSFFSGPTLWGFAGGAVVAVFSNYNYLARVGVIGAFTFLGLMVDLGCAANQISFLNKFGPQLDRNFRECMQQRKRPDACGFTADEIQLMADEIIEANKSMRLILTPQEIILLPTEVANKVMQHELTSPTSLFNGPINAPR